MEKIVFLTILIISLLVIAGSLVYLQISIYFLSFKIEKHPLLIYRIEKVLYGICEAEGIGVFHKTFEELNKDIQDEKDKAVGMYIYTLDTEHQQKINKNLLEIREMEAKYSLPYSEICKRAGVESTIDIEDFVLPKILLLESQKENIWYYSTFFHELGHHFAVKEKGKHDENDANRHAGILIRKYLPTYCLLFSAFSVRFAEGQNRLSYKEKIFALLKYVLFLIEEKKLLQKNS